MKVALPASATSGSRTQTSIWRPLFRKLYRQASAFPSETVSLFYKRQIRADFRSTKVAVNDHQQKLVMLQRANAGHLDAVQSCLQIAFARKGKLRDKRVNALFAEARTDSVPPLQAGVPRTRPPVYTPKLASYVTSPYVSESKAVTSAQLAHPPTLPERANPDGEEARLLGRLHPRREANIRWRYLARLRDRSYAPFTGAEVGTLETLVTTAQVPAKSRRAVPDKESRQAAAIAWSTHKSGPGGAAGKRPSQITPRFMRRRFQEILDTGVTFKQVPLSPAAVARGGHSTWTVQRPDGVSDKRRRFIAGEEDTKWI